MSGGYLLRVEPRSSVAVRQTAAYGASCPLRRIPAIVSFICTYSRHSTSVGRTALYAPLRSLAANQRRQPMMHLCDIRSTVLSAERRQYLLRHALELAFLVVSGNSEQDRRRSSVDISL